MRGWPTPPKKPPKNVHQMRSCCSIRQESLVRYKRCAVRSAAWFITYPPDTQACMFWLRNRQRQYWQAKEETTAEVADDMAALLDAAGESMRHAGE